MKVARSANGNHSSRRGERTGDEIRAVALELFYKRGFQATTLRHIASRVGIKVGSLDNHITSKGGLLFEMMVAADVGRPDPDPVLVPRRVGGMHICQMVGGNASLENVDRIVAWPRQPVELLRGGPPARLKSGRWESPSHAVRVGKARVVAPLKDPYHEGRLPLLAPATLHTIFT